MLHSIILIGKRRTLQIVAKLANAINLSLWKRWDQASASLALVCTVSNFVAFVVSSNLTPKYIELDSLVQPGHLLSLARTEGVILVASVSLMVLVRGSLQRVALQSLVAGFLTADAINDIVLVTTGSWLLATELAYITAASIPAVAVVMAGGGLLRREASSFSDQHYEGNRNTLPGLNIDPDLD